MNGYSGNLTQAIKPSHERFSIYYVVAHYQGNLGWESLFELRREYHKFFLASSQPLVLPISSPIPFFLDFFLHTMRIDIFFYGMLNLIVGVVWGWDKVVGILDISSSPKVLMEPNSSLFPYPE